MVKWQKGVCPLGHLSQEDRKVVRAVKVGHATYGKLWAHMNYMGQMG